MDVAVLNLMFVSRGCGVVLLFIRFLMILACLGCLHCLAGMGVGRGRVPFSTIFDCWPLISGTYWWDSRPFYKCSKKNC